MKTKRSATNEVSHTPTPWEFETGTDGAVIYRPDSGTVASLNTGHELNPEADAAFIVRAVNAHEEMLQLIKDLNYAFYAIGTPKAMKEVMARSKAVITKAEGK